MAHGIARIALVALLATGCAQESNAFPALSSTGKLQADGAGECGAVAISPTRAITAAHCVKAEVFYHEPGTANGRRVSRVWLGKQDIACLEVATGEADAPVGPAYQDSAVTLESNLSGVVGGFVADSWIADLPSRQGESGSAVRDESGVVVGLVSAGIDAVKGHALKTKLASAEQAAGLCGG